jgi:2-(1,2-epoxy-1,2-dihydrophenyl)acetyl-CoA isomerase
VSEETSVLVELSGDAAYLTLSAPSRKNPVSRAVFHELGAELKRITGMSAIRFVVLRGEGGNFSSGGDLEELEEGLPQNYIFDYWQRMAKTILHIRSADQIFASAVQGVALGAGAGLALASDIVIAEEDARFRFHFVHLGLLPDAGTSAVLPSSVGLPVARDLLLSGRWLSAREAHQRGLIARVVPVGTIDAAIEALLDELRLAPPETLSLAKSLIGHDILPAIVRMEGVYQKAAAASINYQAQIAEVQRTLKTSAQKPSDNQVERRVHVFRTDY